MEGHLTLRLKQLEKYLKGFRCEYTSQKQMHKTDSRTMNISATYMYNYKIDCGIQISRHKFIYPPYSTTYINPS